MSIVIEKLLANSLAAVLSSIEIYNKPDFKYREEIFTILNINAWELLLKAKILKDSNGEIESLYVMKGGAPKLNRSGSPMTIEIVGAMKRVELDPAITANLSYLIEVRDTAVHFYNDENLSYLVYTLGVASLKNYQKLIKEWFDKSLLDYNFYILPLAFAYNFKTISVLELEKEPEAISNLVKSVSTIQSSLRQGGDFYFVCEVATEIKSAKKFVDGGDLTTVIDTDATRPDAAIIFKTQSLIDKYPLSYTELLAKIRKAIPGIKPSQVNKFIKKHEIKTNLKYSTYSFRTRTQQDNYEKKGILPKSITSIYNEDAVRYIIENIERETSEYSKNGTQGHKTASENTEVQLPNRKKGPS